MRVETRERVIKDTVYIAKDGSTFPTKEECEYHEWKLGASAVYLVALRGQRSDLSELYSTKELAEQAIGDSMVHTITKVYLDQRFWNYSEEDIDVQDARKYFFEEEGYMGTDEECIKYYRRNYENS